MNEVQTKLRDVRARMTEADLAAVRLRGVDWFSWVTGGGSSVVILTAEVGIAEVLITATRACVLTNDIESQRLHDEEISDDFEFLRAPWYEEGGLDQLAREICPPGRIASDRPVAAEQALPSAMAQLKLTLREEEIGRYRRLGQEAAEAMTDALSLAKPDWTEAQLAGEGARELWRRGIHPTLVLCAGEERALTRRHPLPTHKPLGGRAMMVFCGRRHGLYANLTRWVLFRAPTVSEQERMNQVARFEATALAASTPGRTLAEIFGRLASAYEAAGLAQEIPKQHFGGTTGYLSRENFARPESIARIEENMALAWNPTLPGAKIEDTVLRSPTGLEILTVDPRWPVSEIEGRPRPLPLKEY